MRKAISVISAFVLAFVLIGAGCGQNAKAPNKDNQKNDKNQKQAYTLEESKQIAKEWIQNESPTYTFDGSKLKLKESSKMDKEDCQDCYELVYEFESSHGGYGDRSDKMVTQVITPHEMTVIVEQGEVTKAITDGRFDEMNEKMVQNKNNSDKNSSEDENNQ
ncbi:MAG: hypothetical protein ABEJ24_02445 [Candidatus Magasanikbacteria bacterium]